MKNEKVKKNRSPNLKTACHEFLFLKGVWTWWNGLEKPEAVHHQIFEDCIRLSTVRFYNAMMLYSKEETRPNPISTNDFDCNHLRNIMAHNFIPIEQLRNHIETTLFSYGEHVLLASKGQGNDIPTLKLSECDLYKIEIINFGPDDATKCHDMILDRLARIKTYLKLLTSKQDIHIMINSLNLRWSDLSNELKIWIHHAKAIESCLLQIGELARTQPYFVNPNVQNYVKLCREMRHIGYHWEFDPISPDFLADLIQGLPD